MDKSILRSEIELVKNESFVEDYKATDAEAMGLVIAKFFAWDGLDILRTAQFALEDANFHAESAAVSDMADKIEK